LRTTPQLEKYNVVDTTSRDISSSDYVEVWCGDCLKVKKHIRWNNLVQAYDRRKGIYRCDDCSRQRMSKYASKRTREKNHFYQKTHTQDVKDKIAQKNRDRWDGQDENTKTELVRKMRQGLMEKYGENCMNDFDVRNRHYEKFQSIELRNRLSKSFKRHYQTAEGLERKKRISSDNKNRWQSLSDEQKAERLGEMLKAAAHPEARMKAVETIRKGIGYDKIREKATKTYFERTGYEYPLANPEIRKRLLVGNCYTKPHRELYNRLLARYVHVEKEVSFTSSGHSWDLLLYRDGRPHLVIDVDGEYFHGHTNDSFFKNQSHPDNDVLRFLKLPPDLHVLLVDGTKIDESIKHIAEIMDEETTDWVSTMFQVCKSMPFPYPEYDENRMRKDWGNLKRQTQWNVSNYACNSIMTHFHRSIYESRVGTKPSPVEAWGNDDLLMRSVVNRFIYARQKGLTSQHIARGFEVNKLAPRVSVFQASLAKHLLVTFSPDAKTVVDPFSGFSGRMLGAVACGMKYVGFDIREKTIKESKEIAKFLSIEDSVDLVCKDSLDNVTDDEFDVLLTCPPYGDIERWEGLYEYMNETDDYVAEVLRKYKAKLYIFVVNKTERYGDYEALSIKKSTHFARVREKILVISREEALNLL